ncbi:MAG: IS66 family transposase [Planctomycetales bacterium]|nr:IS66 family transposase [Planctomycetales bacterium]
MSKLSKAQLQELVGEQAVELTAKDGLLTAKEALLATQSQEVLRRDDVIKQLEAKIAQLEKDYFKLWQERFAARSERYIADANQLRMDFGDTDEAADAAAGLAEAVEEADLIPEHKRRKPRKKRDESLPAHLPRSETVVEAADADKRCETHGEKTELPESMWDVQEKLVYTPPSLHVEVLKYPKYACPQQPECGISSPARPTGIVEGDKYDTSIATEILVNKFAYHLPIYRQQDMFAGTGWTPPRSTMLNILQNCHFIAQPLLDYFQEVVLTDSIVGCDDTGVTLLYPKELPEFDRSDPKQKRIAEVFEAALQEGKPSINAKMWVYRGQHIKLNVFDFTVSRHRDGPVSFFEDYAGTILGDCWHGFGAIAVGSSGKIVRAACNAHARRKFVDAADYPADRRKWMEWYQELFDIESRAKLLSDEERLAVRQSESKEIWDAMRAELDTIDERTEQVVLPKSDLRKALNYLRNHWTELTRYLDDPTLPIDSNEVEQLMKQIALGRKNWLFCGSVAAGERNAGFMTLVSSAHRNDLDVWAYVNDILTRLLAGETDYEPMLPWNWAMAHPHSIRQFRQEERREREAHKQTNRSKRRARKKLLDARLKR